MDDSNAALPTVNHIPPQKVMSISIHPQEVRDILKSLKTGTAAGPVSVDNRLLKELARPLSSPLTDLFNSSLARDRVPNLWKQANVTPVLKKNDPSDAFNYRSLSLLTTLATVLEKSVYKYVFNFLNDHHVITTLDEGKEGRAIFCDISKV